VTLYFLTAAELQTFNNLEVEIKRLNRKTICFSKNETVHDNVIGMYIENFYYKTGTYVNNFIR
jgi:hypothetical protein